MSDDAVLAGVLEILARLAGPGRMPAHMGAETPLAEDGFWLDSAGQLEAVLECEEAFGVTLDIPVDLDEREPITAGRLAAAIRRRQAAG